MLGTNIVKRTELKKVQQDTLHTIKESLVNTFGPNGSTTVIKKSPAEYALSTKDGHTVLGNIKFSGIIESTVAQELTELTTHIVKTIGDGTTSAIVLSSIIFDTLLEADLKAHPSAINRAFKEAVKDIIDYIESKPRRELTLEDVYDIAITSTNDNKEIADYLVQIYREFGNDVFIDVGISNDENTKIKYYNGTTLGAGYMDPVMITNNTKGTAELVNPLIYIFRDPVDTPDMISLMDTIIKTNIIDPLNNSGNVNSCTPTVIMAPKISTDLAQMMNQLILQMAQYKFPLLIITNIVGEPVYEDLITLTGAKAINRYIDPEIQKLDVEKGLAPTLDTVVNFAGTAEMVVADAINTKFIRPACMYKAESNEYTDEFNNLIKALEAELAHAYNNNESVAVTGKLKRRINSLKANMVEFLIGGVSVADRDSVRDLVEDAVKSLRSTAKYGVGYGSNYEAYSASQVLLDKQWSNGVKPVLVDVTDEKYSIAPSLKEACIEIIAHAYSNLLNTLYEVSGFEDEKITSILNDTEHNCPYNIRTGEFDGKVLTSIESDKIILSTVSKIVTLMYTSNQFMLPDPALNKYMME